MPDEIGKGIATVGVWGAIAAIVIYNGMAGDWACLLSFLGVAATIFVWGS